MPNKDFLSENPENIEFIAKIANLRQAKKLTQRELALRVGVTEATIANWERSRSGIDWIVRVTKLCEALDCQPGDLFEQQIKPGNPSKKLPAYADLYELYLSLKKTSSDIQTSDIQIEKSWEYAAPEEGDA